MLECDQGFAQLLGNFAMRRKVDFVFLQNFFVDERLQKIVNVVAAEMRVAVGGEPDRCRLLPWR
jgi:hypothetical protein